MQINLVAIADAFWKNSNRKNKVHKINQLFKDKINQTILFLYISFGEKKTLPRRGTLNKPAKKSENINW